MPLCHDLANRYKSRDSSRSTATDTCTSPHSKCAKGKYTAKPGTSEANTKCEPCQSGKYKNQVSSSTSQEDSCTSHSKCGPGKYTFKSGTDVALPQCKDCAKLGVSEHIPP